MSLDGQILLAATGGYQWVAVSQVRGTYGFWI